MSDTESATIDRNRLSALTVSPPRWVTVIRRGSTRKEVDAYTNGWPIFELYEGLFIVCVPESQVWLAERLMSGLFYAKVHETSEAAEADAIENADLVSR